MSNIKWIKLSTSMFEDEKIRLIEQMPDADTILIIWVKLLAQAGKTNAGGYIFLSENIPYTEEMLATIFDRPLSTVRLALKTFQDFGMIEIDNDNFIHISNWEKHQNIEGMERIRQQTRERVQRHRERKKLEEKQDEKEQNKDVTLHETLRNAPEEDKNKKKKKKENKNNKYIRDLFDHYLSKNIIQHRKLTNAMRTAINARLRDYSFDELKKALDNYAKVLHSDNHWFTHKYPLADFMRDKDVRKFLDEADPLNNFKNRQKQSSNRQQQRKEIIPDWFEQQKNQQQSKPTEVDKDEEQEMLAMLQRHAND